MSFPEGLNLPLAYGPKDAKSLIIGVLSKEFPLTAKQIYQRVKNEKPNLSLTYQAVHKALGVLSAQYIVQKDGALGYRIRLDWVKDLKQFGENIESMYSGKKPPNLNDLKEGESTKYSFDSYLKYCYWGLDQTAIASEKNKNYVSFGIVRHAWPMVCISEKEFGLVKDVMSTGHHYLVCGENTPLDNLLAQFLQSFNKKVKLNASKNMAPDYYILDDFVITVLFSPKFISKLDEIYKQITNLDGAKIAKLYGLVTSNDSRVDVLITRNLALSQSMQSNWGKYFE